MSLKKYITESERAQAFMVEGDVFTVAVNEELALEFDVVSHTDDSVVVETDDFGTTVLEHCGCHMIADDDKEVTEDTIDEARNCGCGQTPCITYGNKNESNEEVAEDREVMVRARDIRFAGSALDKLPTDLNVKVMANPGDDDEAIYDMVADELEDRYGVKVSGFHMQMKEAEDSHVHDGDMDKAADYKRKSAYHRRMGNDDAANFYKKKVDAIFAKGLNINRALGEDADDAADAIKRRIMNMEDFSEMVRNYGIERIVDAINDEAEDHDDDELGSSDVSAMVNSVIRSLERSKTNEAEYQGRKVKLGKPTRGDVKKYKVYVKNPKTGNVKKVNFGDPNMEIRRDNPKARKSFRARHNCSDKKDRTKAGYWSCRMWSSKPVSKIV